MDILEGTQSFSGPHILQKLSKGQVSVYLIGEEHSNESQCWRDGADIGEMLQRAVYEHGASLYLEMPQPFKRGTYDGVCTQTR